MLKKSRKLWRVSKLRRMLNSFVIDHGTKQSFAGKTLLLDMNALLDAFRLPAEFYDLVNELAELGCDLVTTRSIAIEFLGGTTDAAALTKKQEFLEVTFSKSLSYVYLPLEHTMPTTDEFLLFSRNANKFSLADFELYCTLKKYRQHIALITRNHKDFSTKIMDRLSFITLLGAAEIHTYGVYAYRTES